MDSWSQLAVSRVQRGLAGLLLLSFLAPPWCRAENDPPLEYKVKAAFLLNFTRFVEWPASAFANDRAPFTICVLGEDPFGSALDEIVKGETMNGHPLAIQRIHEAPEAKTCQILFFNLPAKNASRILADSGPGILTVGESPGFLHDGGMIAFVIDNHRVRFDINQRAATNARLVLSSRLLSVARSVER